MNNVPTVFSQTPLKWLGIALACPKGRMPSGDFEAAALCCVFCVVCRGRPCACPEGGGGNGGGR